MSQINFEEFKNQSDWKHYMFHDENGKSENTYGIIAKMIHCISYIGVHTIAMDIRTQDIRKENKELKEKLNLMWKLVIEKDQENGNV